MLVLSEAARARLVDLATGGGALAVLDGVKAHLFTANITPGPTTTLAQLTEATFDGYTKSAALTWDASLVEPGAVASSEADHEFLCDGDTVSEVIYGYYLSHDAVVGPPAIAETLIASERYDTPVTVARAGQGARAHPRFAYP